MLLIAFVVLAVASASCTNVLSQRSVPSHTTGEQDDGQVPGRDVSRPSVRLLSYNIQWGMGADGVRDLDRIVAQLDRLDADVALLSEVDVNWRRSGNVDQPQYISDRADYPYHYYGSSLSTWASGNARSSQYGNLLLSRFPIVSARTISLPRPRGREPRSTIVARLDVDGEPWIVIGTHLGLNSAERLQQGMRLRELADQEAQAAAVVSKDVPVVIMGDFNARPDAPEIARLLRHEGEAAVNLVDSHTVAGSGAGYTFPFPDPYARIDYVFVSTSLANAVTAARPLPLQGSDHLPVVVDIARP